jgi:hypothetical protein
MRILPAVFLTPDEESQKEPSRAYDPQVPQARPEAMRERIGVTRTGGAQGSPETVFFPDARPPALVDGNEFHGGRVCRPKAMGEITLSRLYSKRRFPMKRFLVLAFVGAWSLAGSTGLAFGQTGHPQTPTKPQATKPTPPPPPKKDTRSKPPTQASKPPDHRKVVVDVPKKGGPKPMAKKRQAKPGSAKPGNGSKSGAGSYTSDDYKRDLEKSGQEVLSGIQEELVPDLAVAGGAVAGSAGGPPGAGLGAAGAAIANAPQLLDAKSKETKGIVDGLSATGKAIGSWFNGMTKSKPRPKNAPAGTGK